jgi:UDP-N-acetylglucosamine 2-epimerase (non-hydrolysing)
MHVLHVVGARPNFMKAAPVLRALGAYPDVRQTLVHSGQHYDRSMSDVFFEQLGVPEPDLNLAVGSDTHARQTANIMQRFEPVVLEKRPDWVLVYGDVNSTIAAALVCSKMGVNVAHVEAGLRAFDRTMPEEINRLLTDQISDLLFTPSEDGNANLQREGIPAERVHLVGNVMIDTLIRLLPLAEAKSQELMRRFGVLRFGLVTLHRPATVDSPEVLIPVLHALNGIAHQLPIVFPMHPRTRVQLGDQIHRFSSELKIVEPLPYLEFLALQKHATVVITDSGGIQEETTYLGVPCLTVRDNTERPITITIGTNTVIGRNPDTLKEEVEKVLHGGQRKGAIPPLWDGKASERIAFILHQTM